MSAVALRAFAVVFVPAFVAVCAPACGARSFLDSPPPLPPKPECTVAADCVGFDDRCKPIVCVIAAESDGGAPVRPAAAVDGGASRPPGGVCEPLEPVDCDDGDTCTADLCDPANGACSHPPATLDSDGDGHRAPLVGKAAGAPGSCGDDCDDASPVALPGGIEICDGVDNDCNGIVDDSAGFLPTGEEPIRVSGDIAPAGPGGLAWGTDAYASLYTASPGGTSVYVSMLDGGGQTIEPPGEGLVTFQTADTSGGPVVWIGDRFGVAWQDRRSGDYEVFFSLLDAAGAKKLADTQLSFALGFSVNVTLAWNGAEFLVVWQDDRDGIFNLFAQRVAASGAPIGENLPLTTSEQGLGNESPSVAAGVKSVGVSWSMGDASNHFVQFQVFSPDLTKPLSPQITLNDGTSDAVYPSVVWNKDRYVVSWFDKSAPVKAIYAAAVSEGGKLIVPPKAITSPGPFRSRYPFLRPLGDRLLAVYSDDRDQNDGYEIYSRMIDSELDPIGGEQRITNAKKDSIYPIAAFGPEGRLGILFRDDRLDGNHHVWFTQLGCVTP